MISKYPLYPISESMIEDGGFTAISGQQETVSPAKMFQTFNIM